MGIQEDIKQKKAFRNPHHQAAVNMMFTYNWLNEKVRLLLEPYEITPQQYNVLRILRGSYPDPISTQEIRNRMLDKMSDVSRIVERMRLKRLLTKKTCPNDKRLVDVLISEQGRQLLEDMHSLELDMDAHMEKLNTAEAQQLNMLLDKIRQ
ncbi:MAG: MarR family winged helix-turn-helix transcriptional regulator [Bacteroidia bacterium]